MDIVMRNLSSGFLTRTDTNLAVQTQKMVRGLKFLIQEEEGFNYLCSKHKGADKMHGYLICAFVFAYAKGIFSHDAAHYRLNCATQTM